MFHYFLKRLSVALILSAVFSVAVMAETTIVLVHGAFADGSGWSKVIPYLKAKGYKVVAVQNPLTSLADDVLATQNVIDVQTGDVVLVGHSWGGAVITQAGTSDKVKALVYVAAFAPGVDQSASDEASTYPPTPGFLTLSPDAKGFMYLSEESMAMNFVQDQSKKMASLMTSTQGPIAAANFTEKLTAAAWETKPNYYIVAANDRMIQPDLQRALAIKLNAKTTTLNSSHVPMLSKASKVAKVILEAADSITVK